MLLIFTSKKFFRTQWFSKRAHFSPQEKSLETPDSLKTFLLHTNGKDLSASDEYRPRMLLSFPQCRVQPLTKRTVCMYLVLQSCLTLCGHLDCSPSGSSVHGILQARILGWVTISFSRRSSRPRDQTCVSCVSCVADRFFTGLSGLKCQQYRGVGAFILNGFYCFLCVLISYQIITMSLLLPLLLFSISTLWKVFKQFSARYLILREKQTKLSMWKTRRFIVITFHRNLFVVI